MLNILVPTDFSDLSKVAIRYAVKMANMIEGGVTLLHMMDNVVLPSRSELSSRIKTLEREQEIKAKEEFANINKEVLKLNKTNNPVTYTIVKGDSFSDTVKTFAKKHKSDLIVMGTRGATGVTKFVLGSNTVSVLEGSSVPVLVVPGNAEFKTFKNVAYASDLKHIEREVKVVFPYLKKFDSTLHVLHVAERGKDVDNLKELIKKVLKKVDYRKSLITVEKGKKVDEAIESFITTLKADLVIMFTHKQNFYEKLFNRSMTKEMAFQSKVPLLAFKSK